MNLSTKRSEALLVGAEAIAAAVSRSSGDGELVGVGERYWIPDHVYVCLLASGAIFLDVRRDRYSAMDREQSQLVSTLVKNWPTNVPDDLWRVLDQSAHEDALPLADALESSGLLTREKPNGHLSAPAKLERATVAFVDEDATPINFRDVIRFLWACSTVASALRWRSFESVVNEARRRKARHAGAISDPYEMTHLVSVFRRLRPFAFTAKDQCLFHALALVSFLSLYGVFPTWVVGVKAGPWGAHSWVQDGNLVLDTTPEKVVPFTPIMTI